jgi:hypothetical protein
MLRYRTGHLLIEESVQQSRQGSSKMGSSKRASRSKMAIPVLLSMAILGLVKAELTHNETEQCEFLFCLTYRPNVQCSV